jgi:transposase
VTDAERIAELERENAELRQQVAEVPELRRQVEELRKEIEEWKRGHRERRRRRSSRPEGSRQSTGRGPGRPSGAKGSNRPVPTKIHETVEHPFPAVCECGGPVEATGEVQSTVVQDIPPVEVCNTRHVAPVGQCGRCEKRHVARLPGSSAQGEPCAQVQLGPGVQALAISLHFEHSVPLLGVGKILGRWFSVSVSAPGLSQMFDRLRVRTAPSREEVLGRLRQSPVIGFDETSHRQEGHSAWLWLGRTSEVSYFHVDVSRGAHVFEKILGEGFVGIVCSDFYGVYTSRTDLLHAYCNAHTVRKAKKIAEVHPSPLTQEFSVRLSDILADGRRAQVQIAEDPIAAKTEATNVRRRLRRLIDTERFGTNPDVRRLQDRMNRHFNEVLLFTRRPDVPMTNNDTERDLRIAAVHRKISGGTRSEGGSETYAHWMTITQTLRKNDRNLRTWVRDASQAHLLGRPPPSVLATPAS